MPEPQHDIDRYARSFIGGRWLDAADGRRLELRDPATAEPMAEVAQAGEADVEQAVAAARECVTARTLRDMEPGERARMMYAVARELRAMRDEIALAECLDSGKALSFARGQADEAARYFEYYGGLADKIEGRAIPLGPGYVDYTACEPYGVSAQIVPWNYPLSLAARSVSCALATANAVVVKSPELAPLSVHLLAKACERAEVPAGAVNVICGLGGETGAALVSHPQVDHIVFTGSVDTGKAILRAAAERVVPCVMELGGKSAAIVYPDADLDGAVQSIADGIFTNAGQTCSAPSRLLVQRGIAELVTEKLVAHAEGLSIGPGIDEHDVGPLISAAQRERVEAYCERARGDGAKAITGGRRVEGLSGYFMQPTVFTDVGPETSLACEEVFGPVLAVQVFDEPRDAVELANATDYGLCGGCFTRDLELAHWTADRLVAGQVYVNEWFAGGVQTPFGGMRKSGYGREKGQQALQHYVQTKNVAVRL